MSDKPRDENMIAALKRERAGYLARGEEDRAGQVDVELAKYGVGIEKPTGRATREERQATADDKPAKSTAAKTTEK
jgi:hypothetical protein